MAAAAPFDAATLYVDAAQLELALERARVGQQFVYASGSTIDPGHPAVQAVKRWADRGAARLNFARRDGRGQYLVTRCAEGEQPTRDGKGPTPNPSRKREGRISDEFLETTAGRLLRILMLKADHGLPCPSDSELGDLLGLRDRKAASYQLSLLIAAGHVEVTNPAPRKRVVRIVSTGKRTAEV